MKINFKYIVAALAMTALFASCDYKADFISEKFVTMDDTSYSVNEDVGEIVIPVHIYNQDCHEVQISVKGVNGTAVEGKDYEILSPKSGLLTFPGGTDSLSVKVAIKPQVGVYTGNLTFNIQVTSATEGVKHGNVSSSSITIKDLDHPLAAMLGDWTSTGPVATSGGTLGSKTFTISADETDVTKVLVDNLDIMFAELNGLVAPDYNRLSGQVNEDKTKITIKAMSLLGFGTYFISGLDTPLYSSATTVKSDIVLVLNADGTLTLPNGFVTGNSNSGAPQINFYVIGGVTFTRK